jgi:hypothetical protein
MKSVIGASFALACIAFARTAYGFLDPPYLTPALPLAGDTVSVNIYGGVCDAIVGIPGYPIVTQNGNEIRIVLWSARYTDPILCNFGTGTSVNAVGAYPAGAYTLQVDREYFDALGGIVTETLGVIPFVVAGQVEQPVPLPTLNWLSLSALGLLLCTIALSKFHQASPPR